MSNSPRPRSPKPSPLLRRYLVHFPTANLDNVTVPIGASAFSKEDLAVVLKEGGFRTDIALAQIDEDIDLSALPDRTFNWPPGPPNWRGIWYPKILEDQLADG
jgi:hypothetical protein